MTVCEICAWLDDHPIFIDTNGMSRFKECIDWTFVLVNPETREIDDDPSKNTESRCWLELGPWIYDEHSKTWGATHDYELDCGGATFEEAITKLYYLVIQKYGSYPRKFVEEYYDGQHGDLINERKGRFQPMKIAISKDKKAANKFHLKGEFTEGQLLAIRNALDAHGTAVARDVLIQLDRVLPESQ